MYDLNMLDQFLEYVVSTIFTIQKICMFIYDNSVSENISINHSRKLVVSSARNLFSSWTLKKYSFPEIGRNTKKAGKARACRTNRDINRL